MAKIVDLAGVLTYDPSDFCFGFLEDTDTLYLGHSHHAAIIADLIQGGMTWAQLLNTQQMWGWAELINEAYPEPGESTTPTLDVSFSTDEAKQDIAIRDKVIAALHQVFPDYEIDAANHANSTVGIEQYGDRAKEQYLGEEPSDSYYGKVAAEENWTDQDWKDRGLSSNGCFGFVDGHLIFGSTHHQMIMAALLNKGWTWNQLNRASQAWGWYQVSSNYGVSVRFSSDAGVQKSEAVEGALEAFKQLYHLDVKQDGSAHGVSQDSFGSGLKGRGYLKSYLRGGRNEWEADQIKNVPEPPVEEEWTDDKEQRLQHLQELQNSGHISEEESSEFLNLWIEQQSHSQKEDFGDIDDLEDEPRQEYCSYCDEYYDPYEENHDHSRYCDHCDTSYDPEEEDHDHDIQYCKNCDEYYDNNDYYYSQEHDHFKVKEDWNDSNTKEWFTKAYEKAKENIEEGYTQDPKSQEEIASDTKDWLVSEEDFDVDNAEWLSEAVGDYLATQNSKIENPPWVPKGLHIVQPQQNKPIIQPGQKLTPINPSPQGFMIPQGAPPIGSTVILKGLQSMDAALAQKRYIIGYNADGPIIAYYPPDKIGYGAKYPITWADFNKGFQVYKTSQRIARVTDLHDEDVFAILSHDYLKYSEEGGAINSYTPQADRDITIGSKWVDPQGLVHQVTGIGNAAAGDSGRVFYNFPTGHGSMSVSGWHYLMKPYTDSTQAAPTDTTFPEQGTTHMWAEYPKSWTQDDFTSPNAQQPIDDPQVEGEFKDDPRLLAIERNPASAEWRWSMDDNQLHIWRVINRYQYGPSHYDMFGSEGYSKHSQGRVYVSPDGEVGVLYWQITHDNAEQTLNDWVQQKFGKQPDMVYRAYGPYRGVPTSRWDYPIVEVSGLPISKGQRWWERPDGKPNSWYREQGLPTPTNKGEIKYPAKSQKTIVQGDQPYANTPGKAKRRKRRSRGRSKQYRNRGRR